MVSPQGVADSCLPHQADCKHRQEHGEGEGDGEGDGLSSSESESESEFGIPFLLACFLSRFFRGFLGSISAS